MLLLKELIKSSMTNLLFANEHGSVIEREREKHHRAEILTLKAKLIKKETEKKELKIIFVYQKPGQIKFHIFFHALKI